YVGVGLALLLAGTGLYRRRVRVLKRAAETLEAKVKQRTLELSAAYADLAEKDQRIGEDLAQAHAFQRRILPVLPKPGAAAFAAVFLPVEAVGGDVYDV